LPPLSAASSPPLSRTCPRRRRCLPCLRRRPASWRLQLAPGGAGRAAPPAPPSPPRRGRASSRSAQARSRVRPIRQGRSPGGRFFCRPGSTQLLAATDRDLWGRLSASASLSDWRPWRRRRCSTGRPRESWRRSKRPRPAAWPSSESGSEGSDRAGETETWCQIGVGADGER